MNQKTKIFDKYIYICSQVYSKQNKEEILMIITVYLSLGVHMIVAGIYNYLLLLLVLYSLCL